MGKPNSAMGRSRDFGILGGPGKGDKSRVTNQSAYAANFDEINWGHNSKPAADYAETEGEWDRIPANDRLRLVVNNNIPITNDIIRE